MKTLVLIDGHSMAYRMHFALERTNMRTATGTATWAVYGFFNALFSLLKRINPDAMAVSFDIGKTTFRNDMYPEYKAHRSAMPEDMRAQMGAIREGIERLGIPIYEVEGVEADDVIGTLSCQAAKEGYKVQILTGDQDAFQLVADCDPGDDTAGYVEILVPGRTPREDIKWYNREEVYKKWGVWPEQVTDFKGLKGDTSDNIPGVPGIGDKTACKLLTDYQTIENLYAHIEELPANKMKERLVTYKDQAFLSKQLATIIRDVPVSADWEQCHLAIPDFPALMDYFERQEFKGFIKQAPSLLAPFLQGRAEELETIERLEDRNELQFSVVTVEAPDLEELAALKAVDTADTLSVTHEIIRTPAQLNEWIQLIRAEGVVAIDVETTGLDPHTAKLAGIALSVGSDCFEQVERPAMNKLHLSDYPDSFPALSMKSGAHPEAVRNAYVPIRHADQNSELTEADIQAALSPVLADASIIKLIHNLKFEKNIFRQWDVTIEGLVFDTMLASYVQDPDRRAGLKNLSVEIFGKPMCEIKELIGSGKKQILFSDVPVEDAAGYAACDTFTTWMLAAYFAQALNEQQWTLFYEVELPLAHVLADVEWTGVALDTAYLKTLSGELDTRLIQLEKDICVLAGCEFNLNSPKQVGEVLFEKLGIPPSKKTKGKTGYSTDVKVLEQLAGEYEIVRLMLEYRQLFKLKSTYIDTLPELINERTGRIHTNFNQTVTATGRLSSAGPNLQNIPIRSELGAKIRQAFIPGERPGWVLLSADYSQIELRLLAHFSEDPYLMEAFAAGEDVHTATAALVFGMERDKVTKEQRYRAKAVNFGVVYGQSAFGLATTLKIPQKEAGDFINRYFTRYSAVKRFIEHIKSEAHQTGKVQTICGRVRDLSEGLQSSNRGIREFSERAAFNTPLQGSAADLMKVAMIRLHRKLTQSGLKSRILLQVHDELVLEVPDAELAEVEAMTRSAMQLDQPLKVPLVVDVYAGPTWMES